MPSNAARSEGRGDDEPANDQTWFTTAQAAAYLQTSPKALLMRVARGVIQPDGWGGRGRSRTHMFSRETLDKHVRGDKAA